MRSHVGAALCIAAALASAGCDTEQPDDVGKREAALTFTARATMPAYKVYPVFLDNDGDDVPDDGQTSLYCEQDGTFTGVAPMSYGVRVRVLRENQISPEIIVDSTVYPPNFDDPTTLNLGDYDTSEEAAGDPLNAIAVTVTGRCSLDSSTPCDEPSDCSSQGKGTCHNVGTCDADPNTECYKPPAGFPAVFTGCSAAFAPCDCNILGDFFGVNLGFCCTPELDQGLAGECNSLKFGRCTQLTSIGCQPGCEELGAGVECSGEPETQVFKFGAPRRLAASNLEVLTAGVNAIAAADPGQAPTQNPPGGVCPGRFYGEPGIQGQGQPFKVSLNKGDVLLVEGKFYSNSPPGVTWTPLGVGATLTVDGEPVTPTGAISSLPNSPNSAIDYRYTAR